MAENAPNVIEMLEGIEDAVARLYRAYAGLFPDLAAFWEHLANDEMRHRDWVAGLRQDLQAGLVTPIPERTSPEAFGNFRAYLEAQIAEAGKRPITLFQALSTARAAEQTYFEKNLLQVFETDSDGVRRVLEGLAEDTERHYRVINAEWEQYRPSDK
ncbi:MAG TPA: hypothetical protein VGM23_16635 [Armatimonadota bacterium]